MSFNFNRRLAAFGAGAALLLTLSPGPSNAAAAYSLTKPSGWSASQGSDGRIVLKGPRSASGVIWPFFLRTAVTAVQAQAVMRALSTAAAPQVAWSGVRASSGALLMNGSAAGRSAVAFMQFANGGGGSAGVLYVASAPKANRVAAQRDLARIFASFRINGQAAGSSSVSYVTWTDPLEHAFTIDVPKGWRVAGGLKRYATLDTRPSVVVTSPTGDESVLIGDWNVPTFVEPMPFFPEGSTYSPGYGVQNYVMHYMKGVEFANWYVQQLAQSNKCTGLSISNAQNLPDQVAALNKLAQAFLAQGISVTYSAGAVDVACNVVEGAVAGKAVVATQRIGLANGGPSNWSASTLIVATARNGKLAHAQEVAAHMTTSYRVDPQWQARQDQATMTTSRIAANTQNEISDIMSQAFASRNATMDEISRRRSNATLGLVDTVDPQTGTSYKVDSGSNYYWVDSKQNIVGTNTSAAPGLDFRALTQLP